MSKRGFSIQRARAIRRDLVALIDKSEIYPRRSSRLDPVALALFSRMAELHEAICLLASKERQRDAVILARTLCEATITLYWLTNNRESDERVERYIAFRGQVTLENIGRIKKHFGFEYVPSNPAEVRFLKEASVLFQKDRYKWNPIPIGRMASETDTFEPMPRGKPPGMEPVYELFYFWYSLLAHPCIMAIEDFLPTWGEPFKCTPPRTGQSLPENNVVFLSTCWLFSMALRISTFSLTKRGHELERIWRRLRRK